MKAFYQRPVYTATYYNFTLGYFMPTWYRRLVEYVLCASYKALKALGIGSFPSFTKGSNIEILRRVLAYGK